MLKMHCRDYKRFINSAIYKRFACIRYIALQQTHFANMKLIVIGDIHGRTNWKQLVDKSAMNVFVGDYFDPYENCTFDELKQNFLEIIQFKTEHPENVVLLLGNHDYHYIHRGDKCSRFDWLNAANIRNLFVRYKRLFHGIAYSPDEKHIITHAGITSEWAKLYLPTVDEDTPLKELEMLINNLWATNHEAFSFDANSDSYDAFGTTPTQSPIWIRPEALAEHALNINKDWIQIVGHTQVEAIVEYGKNLPNLIFVDVLGCEAKAYVKML